MKRIILAINLLTMTATAVFAGNAKEYASLTAEQKVNRDIQAQLYVPKILSEVPGDYKAEMHFHVTAEGSLVVNEIITDNDDLKHSLMLQAKGIKVNTEGLDTGSSYKITIRYKVVESD